MHRFFAIVLILVLAAIVNHGFSNATVHVDRRPLEEFPETIGNWITVDQQVIEKDAMAILNVDDYMMRIYSNQNGDNIGIYIGYFQTQHEEKRIHSPFYCLPAAGWYPVERKEHSLSLSSHSSIEVPVNLYVMAKGSQKQLYIWWYQGRGRTYSNEYLNRFYLVWDAITKRRTDGALVRVNMSLHSDSNETFNSITSFIDLFFPLLPQYIPN